MFRGSGFHGRCNVGQDTVPGQVQSLNSPLLPPHGGAEPGRAKREYSIAHCGNVRALERVSYID